MDRNRLVWIPVQPDFVAFVKRGIRLKTGELQFLPVFEIQAGLNNGSYIDKIFYPGGNAEALFWLPTEGEIFRPYGNADRLIDGKALYESDDIIAYLAKKTA